MSAFAGRSHTFSDKKINRFYYIFKHMGNGSLSSNLNLNQQVSFTGYIPQVTVPQINNQAQKCLLDLLDRDGGETV